MFRFCILSLFTAALLSGTTRTVKTSGGDHATLQACSNVAVAGDTCEVYAGTYGGWTQSANGSSGSPITFKAHAGDSVTINSSIALGSSRSYITIGGSASNEGFEITGGNINWTTISNVIIQNNNIHDTGSAGRCLSGPTSNASGASTYVYVLNNTITKCGTVTSGEGDAQGLIIEGDHWLVSGNTFSHLEDGIAIYCAYCVVRNNHFGPINNTTVQHPDASESSCSGDYALTRMVYENNVTQEWRGSDTHVWLLRDVNNCGQTDNILRHNTAINVGIYWVSTADNSKNLRIYHNSESWTGVDKSGGERFDLTLTNTNTGAKIINNIFANMWQSTPPYCYLVDTSSLTGLVEHHNLCYMTGFSSTWTAPNGSHPYDASNIFNSDPKFVGATSDLTLQASSPAIDAGGSLTNVAVADTGTGTSLVLDDAGFFQDGYGLTGVQADWLQIGSSTTVQISSINYGTNTVTLTGSVSRNGGDPVYLYKRSDGTQVIQNGVPDIGAYEYTTPAPTTVPRFGGNSKSGGNSRSN